MHVQDDRAAGKFLNECTEHQKIRQRVDMNDVEAEPDIENVQLYEGKQQKHAVFVNVPQLAGTAPGRRNPEYLNTVNAFMIGLARHTARNHEHLVA